MEVVDMAVKTENPSRWNSRKEYLVTFNRPMMGKALRALLDLGITREIRCYPERRMLLLEEELMAL